MQCAIFRVTLRDSIRVLEADVIDRPLDERRSGHWSVMSLSSLVDDSIFSSLVVCSHCESVRC